MRAAAIKLVIGLCLLIALLILGSKNVQWQSSLLQTLPAEVNPLHQAYQDSQQSNEQQLMIWLRVASQHANALDSTLTNTVLPYLAAQHPRIEPNQQLAIEPLLAFYRQHSGLYVADTQLRTIAQQPEQVIASAQQRLQQPSPIWTDIAQDPLLLTQNFVETLPDLLPGFQYQAPFYVRNNATTHEVLLILSSGADGLNQQQAQHVVEQLETQLTALQTQFPELESARSGFVFHAAAAATQAKYEMTLFGGLSMLFVLLVLFGAFRSLRYLAFTLLVIITATIAGFTAVFWVFETPHVLMLVFATTLIGLCIDYVFHACIAASNGRRSWQIIVPALWLGGLTTIAGYVLLTLLALPLLQQLGIFMAAALMTVLVVVVYLVPRFRLDTGAPPRWQQWHQQLTRHYARFARFRPQVILPLLALVSITFTASQFRVDDSVRQLTSSPATLVAQEQHMRTVINAHFDVDVLLIHADTIEHLLERYAAVAEQLPSWQAQQHLERWQSLFDYVRTPAQQQQALNLQQQLWQHSSGANYLQWLGIDAPAHANVEPWESLLNHPLTASFIYPLQHNAGYLGVIRLGGVSETLADMVQPLAQVELYNPLQQAAHALASYRQQLQWWLVGLISLAWVVLTFRLRPQAQLRQRLYLSTQVIAVIVIALAGSLSLALLQMPLNVFHFVGAILVVVLGLDYGIFCASNADRPHILEATSLSALTSIIAFGALSFSTTPAIAAFGQVVFWGVLISAFFAPLITHNKN